MSEDITTRLRRWTHDVDAIAASDLMDEAADEIERLRWRVMTLESAARYAESRRVKTCAEKTCGSGNVTPVAQQENDEKRAFWHTNHDAAPAARASVGRPRTDKADLPTRCGTGDTQLRNGALSGCETVPDPDSRVWETQRTPQPQMAAWQLVHECERLRDELASATRHMEMAEAAWLRETAGNSPVAIKITDAEREALEVFAAMSWTFAAWSKVEQHADTLRGLLERLE